MKTHLELLEKINLAVKAANAAEAKVTTAQAELVSRSKAVGLLLLEAKKLHPAVKDFEAFLAKVDGLKLSRAYDCMRIAGGRTTDDELKKDARERKQKSREKKRETQKKKLPEPKSDSVTDPHVTESSEVSIEQRRLENAALDEGIIERVDRVLDNARRRPEPSAEEKAKWSARNLREFEYACKEYLPRLNEADLKTARAFVTLDQWRSKAEAA